MDDLTDREKEYCQRFSDALNGHRSIAQHPKFLEFVHRIGCKTASMATSMDERRREAFEGWNHGWYQRDKEASKGVTNLAKALENMGPAELEHWMPPLETVAMIVGSSEDDLGEALQKWTQVTMAAAKVITMRQELPKPTRTLKKHEAIQGVVFWLAQAWEECFQTPPSGGDGSPFTTLVTTYFELSPWRNKPPSHPNIREALKAYEAAKTEGKKQR